MSKTRNPKSKYPKMVLKFKTLSYEIYKKYPVLPQKEIEDFLKSLWELKGSCADMEKDELDKCIIAGNALADALGIDVREDKSIRLTMKDSKGISLKTGDAVTINKDINHIFCSNVEYEFRYATSWSKWGITDGGAFISLDSIEDKGAQLTIVSRN